MESLVINIAKTQSVNSMYHISLCRPYASIRSLHGLDLEYIGGVTCMYKSSIVASLAQYISSEGLVQ